MKTFKEEIKIGGLVRQGDVTLIRVAQLPATVGKIPAENGRTILAHGEVTGHHHSLDGATATLHDVGRGELVRFLELVAPTELTHQEHDAIALPAGTYEVRRQLQYSPAAIERVAD